MSDFSSESSDSAPMASEDELLQCAELRSEEWTVLSSVYPEYTSLSEGPQAEQTNPVTIRLEIPVELEESHVEIDCEGSSQAEQRVLLTLSSLPSLVLTLLLPPTYPTRTTPLTIYLHASHGWLAAPDIQKMAHRLRSMWEEDLEIGSGSLWRTCEWIRNGTFLEDIGRLTSSRLIRLAHPKPSLLADRLRENDSAARMNVFANTKFECQICLSSVKGSQCIRLNCNHVFCRSCLTDFWSLCIKEGDVDRVTCADPQCVKENRPITEDEVQRVVTAAEAQRWRTLRTKRALEKDPGLVYCPIAFCQAPCPRPQAHNNTVAIDDMAMRRQQITLRSCDNCSFSFCVLCKRSWHGLAPCSSDVTAKFLEEYMSLEENDVQKLVLESRFGKAQLLRLVEKFKEDLENQKWLEQSTTKCPNCLVSVEKSVGCNHMTCGRCSTHFCYLCGLKLPGDRPYDHFSAQGPCKGQLFQMAEWDPDENELMALAAD